jgi:hypothetical protein
LKRKFNDLRGQHQKWLAKTDETGGGSLSMEGHPWKYFIPMQRVFGASPAVTYDTVGEVLNIGERLSLAITSYSIGRSYLTFLQAASRTMTTTAAAAAAPPVARRPQKTRARTKSVRLPLCRLCSLVRALERHASRIKPISWK